MTNSVRQRGWNDLLLAVRRAKYATGDIQKPRYGGGISSYTAAVNPPDLGRRNITKAVRMDTTVFALPLVCFREIFASLRETSDRARIIVAAAWIEDFLKVKILNEFAHGDSRARENLFDTNGPFGSLSRKLETAFCAGWIDADVYHDIHIIRRLRNEFAHVADSVSFNDEKYRGLIEKLRVPYRQYFDWGAIHAGRQGNSIVICSGEPRDDFDERLYVSGVFTFQMAVPILMKVLAANLKIAFATDTPGTAVVIELPEYMQ